ncbi:Zinc transporter ZIP3 [Halotydeus destructor]|nr:Zinc transporter ZIP3 [Halotydeus destructor]
MDRSMFMLEAFFAISMYIGTMVSYLLPLRLIKSQSYGSLEPLNPSLNGYDNSIESKGEKIVRCCNCVGAGIFVAICFLGLMPIVREEFELFFAEAQISGISFPVPEFTVLFGFFFILVIEEIVHSCRKENHHQPILNLDLDEDNSTELNESLIEKPQNQNSQNADDIFEDVRITDPSSSHWQNHHSNGHFHTHSHSHNVDPSETGLTFFILMFATSVHSVFEGLALGLLKEPTRAIHIFIGIILHECIVAAALGLNASKLTTNFKQNIKFAAIFSATVPVGIFLGVGLGYTPGIFGRFISAIFQGLAAGTFLHVTFCELIPAELSAVENPGDRSLSSNRLFKIFLIFIGYILMSLFTLFFDH